LERDTMGRRAREAKMRELQAKMMESERALRRREDEIALLRGESEPRLAIEDISARGTSRRRLQLIVQPSFSKSGAWEIRETEEGEWLLFSSNVVEFRPTRLKGWWRLPIESAILKLFIDRVSSLTSPLGPPQEEILGRDGTMTQLAAFSGFAEYRFQWWSEYPPAWRPLVIIAEEMLKVFTAAEQSFIDANSPSTTP
jgi:hypothetical protein